MTKTVKCFDCGYLCILEVSPIFLGDRTVAKDWVMPQYEYKTEYMQIYELERKEPSKLERTEGIHCYRRAFDLEGELKDFTVSKKKDVSASIKSIIEKPRACSYHVRYVPGYSPEQHLIRWENLEREQSNRRWSLLYVLIGAIITATGALAIKLIFG